MLANYPDGNYVFQQDGAPCHTARTTQEFLQTSGILFWNKDMWPPSSPDLNSLDFAIWTRVETEACRVPHPNLDALRAAIRRAWDNMESSFVTKVCASFRRRLEAVVSSEGDYIE